MSADEWIVQELAKELEATRYGFGPIRGWLDHWAPIPEPGQKEGWVKINYEQLARIVLDELPSIVEEAGEKIVSEHE